jgi:DnaJ like chaperone protein
MQRPPWLGRAIGAGIGWLLIGPFGALLGLVIGYFVDQAHAVRAAITPGLDAARNTFFETAFTLMGRIAKSDGRVSEQEVAVTEQLMGRMGLSAEHRKEAIALFKRGAAPEFAVDAQLERFMADCGAHPNLRHMLLMFLFSTAAADGALDSAEHALLSRIATRIGFSAAAFEQLLRMFSAQDAFSQAPGAPARAHELKDAYAALGVSEDTDDRAVKHAYRRLMSQYHPDKLIAEGMPEDMVRMATERTQEIQNAWELVRKARGID